MHTTQQRAMHLLGALALLASPALQAAEWPDGLTLSCSGTLAQTDGADLSLSCDGNFSVLGRGVSQTLIERSGSISLAAAGDLTLDSLSLSAPRITMSSQHGQILLAPDLGLRMPGSTTQEPSLNVQGEVRLLNATGVIVRQSGDLQLSSGALQLEPAGQVSVTGTSNQVSSVPEPSTGLLGLMGAALALARTCARTRPSRRQDSRLSPHDRAPMQGQGM